MQAKRLDNGEIYELTGSVYTRSESNDLLLAVSYEVEGYTNTNYFPVNEET